VRLNGKVALIAGVGPDVGRLAALTFAREGAAVALLARTRSRLEAFAAEIEAAGGSALVVPADITDEAGVQEAVRRTHEKFGRLDILLNNATYAGDLVDFPEMTRAAWDSVILGALTGYMFTAREAAKVMIAQRSGSIIQVSSGAGSVGFSRRSHYAVAKAGVNNLTHTLAWELGRHGIRVNTIVLGAVMTTSWLEGALAQERAGGITVAEREKRWARRSPIGRMVRPQEVADLALYLASDESASMTGQCLNLTAGVVQS
jgi:NAD(P)-dependent dehydrogenase (short-subunit alcohol dehydrogenase family)